MSQNSIIIANGSGLAVRTNLNNALDSIVTDFSGSSAPSSPKTLQTWMDTSASPYIYKKYDGADWVVLGVFDSDNNVFTPSSALPYSSTSTRPDWIEFNSFWVYKVSSSIWRLYWYDGVYDSLIGTKNPTTGAWVPAIADDSIGADQINGDDAAAIRAKIGVSTASGSETVTAGENLADRDLIYQDVFNQRGGGATKWYKVDADATSPVRISPRVGIALESISSAATGAAQVHSGRVDGFTSLTAGGLVWASSTAGGMTQTAPAVPSSGTQTASRLIGVAASTTEIDFTPDTSTTFIARNASLSSGSTISVVHWTDGGARERVPRSYIAAPSGYVQIPFSGGTVSASSIMSGSYPAANAIDGNTSTEWISNSSSDEWVNYAFANGVIPTKVEFWPGKNTANGDRVANWELRGSNDSFSTSTLLASGTEGGLDAYQSSTFSNTTAYTALRFLIKTTDGGSLAGLKEWRIYASTTARDEPVRIGSATIDSAATDCVTVKFADTSDANQDTVTTFTNRTGETRDIIVEVTM